MPIISVALPTTVLDFHCVATV